MKYEVDTRIMDGRFIESDISLIDENDMIVNMNKIILDTQNEQIKQNLILLGWTPPKEV